MKSTKIRHAMARNTHTHAYTTVTTLFCWVNGRSQGAPTWMRFFRSSARILLANGETFVLEFPLYEQYSRFMAE